MGDSGISLPDEDDLGIRKIGLKDGRVAVPPQVVRALSWIREDTKLVQCIAVLVRPGRVVVLPTEVAHQDPYIAELLAARRASPSDLRELLRLQAPAEIVRRLSVTAASVSTDPTAFRLRLSRNLFPALDISPEERHLFLFESAGHLEVASLDFARREHEKWAMSQVDTD